MLSNILDRASFLVFFFIVILLPLFFIPLTRLPIESAKGFLLVIGIMVSLILWTIARFYDGKMVLPKSLLLLSGLGISVAFLISALHSSARVFSLFGTNFDIGSF